MKRGIALTFGAAVLVSSGVAHAQSALDGFSEEYNRGRNVSVLERARPDYDSAGVPFGGFRLRPSVSAALDYTDNIFASDTNKQSDVGLQVTPGFSLASDWGRNALGFDIQATRYQHFDVHSQNATDYSVGANGRLDIMTNTSVSGFVRHAELTESRLTSTAAAASIEPSQYTQDSAEVQGVRQFDRLRLRGTFDYVKSNYENLDAFGGGIILNDGRDNDLYTYSGRADYALSPDTALFVDATYNDRAYKNDTAALLGNQQDSSGYSVLVGANFDLTNLIRGELGVGYLSQSFSGITGGTDGFAAAGKLEYFPTQLTTFTLSVNRAFVDSSVLGSPGEIASSVDLRVDHELLRNVLLYADAAVAQEDYASIDRTDLRYGFGFGATYLVNRALQLTASFNHNTQNSNGASSGYEYDINQVSVGLTLRR